MKPTPFCIKCSRIEHKIAYQGYTQDGRLEVVCQCGEHVVGRSALVPISFGALFASHLREVKNG